MKPIIRVENLAKRYQIGAREASYRTLRDTLVGVVRSPFSRAGGQRQSGRPTVWALKDVSFDVHPGEIVGIVGQNGAGKSTLLKILSQITEPTRGRAELYGRIGSLLEVGTGFHPELTGRENVYLNGAILGMKRAEIARKFDEIVAFSEIERFIDTPVKWYSSGMYLRLAFSVAAHLDPEILVLDEVMAVGDASFQEKCLNKMQEIMGRGRTILFVSHNMQSITRLCKRVIYISGGEVVQDGPAHQVASLYLSARLKLSAQREWQNPSEAPGNDIVRLRAVRVRSGDGEVTSAVSIHQPVGIEMEFDVLRPGHVLVPNYHFINEEGIYVFVSSDQNPQWRRTPRPAGRYTSTVRIPGNFLSEGTLTVSAAVSTLSPVRVHFYEREAVAFQVIDRPGEGSARGDYAGHVPGVVRPLLPWEDEYRPPAGAASQTGVAS
jgi:lipopolysaccharide transport system ATP-binding protein